MISPADSPGCAHSQAARLSPWRLVKITLGSFYSGSCRSGLDHCLTFGPISHASCPKLFFWSNFQMILHGFAPRSPKNMFSCYCWDFWSYSKLLNGKTMFSWSPRHKTMQKHLEITSKTVKKFQNCFNVILDFLMFFGFIQTKSVAMIGNFRPGLVGPGSMALPRPGQ